MPGGSDGTGDVTGCGTAAPPTSQRRNAGADHGLPRMIHFHILQERPEDAVSIEPLLDASFGDDRQQKTVYRLREGIAPLPDLCFVATDDDGRMLASLRFWPILIEDGPAILLGPLAVDPKMRGCGIGRALVRHGLDTALRRGDRMCVVVGEPEYYGPFGFMPATPAGLVLPGPVEPRRFQVLDLVPGASETTRGLIQRDERYALTGPTGRHLRPGATAQSA